MDRDAVSRLAATLHSESESSDPISMDEYRSLRQRVFHHVGQDDDLEAIFIPNPDVGGYTNRAIGAKRILTSAAVYLKELSTRHPGEARRIAATDLMEQAEQLLAETGVSEAAPIVLGGAALEEVLRDLVEVRGVEVSGKPSLTKYAEALRADGVLGSSEVKEVTSLADTRNAAAHGQFDELSRERARLFLDRVNFMLQQLLAAHNGEN